LLLKTGFTILHKFERHPKSKGELDYTKLYVIAQKSRKPTEI
jgi:hypothetical protein